MKNVSVKDVTIASEAFGSPADAAIVLAMGATASMLGWPDDLCRSLAARGFFVIRYDHRDTGESTTSPPGKANYSVEDMAGDLIGVMDAYKIAKAHVVGMSLGGYIAQMAALSNSARVNSLTLIGSEPLGWDGPPLPNIGPGFMEHFNQMAELDWSDHVAVEAFLVGIARLCAGSAYAFDPQQARHEIRAVLARTKSIASAFNHALVQARGDWTGCFRQIAQPVLVIHGEEDPVLPLANGEALASGIPNARLMVLKGVGHELPAAMIPTVAASVATFATAA